MSKHSIHLVASIDDQSLELRAATGKVLRRYAISTGARGVGFMDGSLRTPTGRFLISEKIGDREPLGTIFRARRPVGQWHPNDSDGDFVLTRILRLKGCDPENANTAARYIYIHGTNQEERLGSPASHGCLRLSNRDVIDLFDRVDCGIPLTIMPPTKPTKLLFLDCDSTLSTIEGIDELARAAGNDVHQQVVALTNATMNGEIPIDEVFAKRLNLIKPDEAICHQVAELYIDHLIPGAEPFVRRMRRDGWTPIIISGGFKPLIEPLAKRLGIEHVEAVPIFLSQDGRYEGFGDTYPTTRNMGKNEIIQEWKQAHAHPVTIMIGDGISDLETLSDVDLFIGFGGVVERPAIRKGADIWITDYEPIDSLVSQIDEKLKIRLASPMLEHKLHTAMSTKQATKATTKGKRYTDAEKKEVVDFITEYNSANGRGGQTAAATKFGISQITLASWLKKAGVSAPSKKGKSKPAKTASAGRGRPKGSTNVKTKAASTSAPRASSSNATLRSMITVSEQIEATETRLSDLREKYESLKASL